MASDFLLLQAYPAPHAIRFRHYEWRGAAFTFGLSQKILEIRPLLPVTSVDLCRRPTGGGLVDHRTDWTYALVIPKGHPVERIPAMESYRIVHTVIAQELQSAGVDCHLHGSSSGHIRPGVCFTTAERFDVVCSRTDRKIAGAAQKRNKRGLLFQGYLERMLCPAVSWEEFEIAFAQALALVLEAKLEPVPWPEWDPDLEISTMDQFASPEWLESR